MTTADGLDEGHEARAVLAGAPREGVIDVRDGVAVAAPAVAENAPPARPKDWTFERVGSGVKLIIDHRPQVALALSAYIVFKVLIVARGSIDNAVEIVRSAGVGQVVLGGIVSGFPFLAAAAAGLSMYRIGRYVPLRGKPIDDAWCDDLRLDNDHPGRFVFSWALSIGSVLVAFAFTPWSLFWAVLIVGALLGEARTQPLRQDLEATAVTGSATSKPRSKRMKRLIWIATGLAIALALYGSVAGLLFKMWTAHENITITGESKSLIGYVVDDSGGWLTVLKSGTRQIVKVEASKVTDREVCHPRSPFEKVADISMLQIGFDLFGKRFGTLKDCPKLD